MTNYKQLQILIIDKDKEYLMRLKAVLKKNGFIVKTANSGKKALSTFLSNEIGLILLDPQLLELFDLTVTAQNSWNTGTKDVPFIFIRSASTKKKINHKGCVAMATDHLSRSFNEDLMLLKVNNLLRLSASEKNLKKIKAELELFTKKFQKEVKHSRFSYQSMFYDSPFLIAILDKNGVFIGFNKDKTFSGIKTKALIGKNLKDYPFPLTIENVANPLDNHRSLFETKVLPDPITVELALTKDKKIFIRISFGWIKSANEEDHLQVIMQDITEQKKTQNTLLEKEFMLTESQRIGKIGTWSLEFSDNQIRWTDETYSIYGVDKENFTPSVESLITLLHPDDRPKMNEWIKDSLEIGKQPPTEFRIPMKDGSMRILSGQGEIQYSEKKVPIRVLGTVQDITERKIAEDALKKSEEKYRNLFHKLNEGVLISSPDGNITMVNARFTEMVGYDEKELIGRIGYDFLIGEKDRKSTKEKVNERKSGYTACYQLNMLKKNGEQLPVNISSSPIYSDEGEFKGVMSLLTDIKHLKISEDLLRKNKEKYRNLVETTHEIIFKINADYKLTYANNSFKRLLGYTSVRENALNISDIIDEESLPLLEKHITNSHIIQPAQSLYFTLKNKYGKKLYVIGTILKQFKNNKFEGAEVFFNDITEIKKLNNSLSESEAFNKGILSSLTSEIAVIDCSGTIIAVNNAWNEFSKENDPFYPGRSGVGSNYFTVCQNAIEMGDDTALMALNGIKAILNKKERSFQMEYACHSPQKQRWFLLSVTPFEGASVKAVVRHVNITDRKLSEELILKSKERYEHLVNNINEAITTDDLSRKITFANEQFLKLFDITREDLQNINIENHIAPEYRQLLKMYHTKRIAGEKAPDTFEFVGLKKDGTRRWFEYKVSLNIENGLITGTQSAIRDITVEKENLAKLTSSEEEKSKLLEDLTGKFNDLMQFNYIVSHNLRAPIAQILGLSNIFSLPNTNDKEKSKIIGYLRDSALSMDELVKDLNTILTTKAPLNEKKETVIIREIIQSNIDSIEKQISDAKVAIEINIEDDAKKMLTIKRYLESVFYNLISNSVKYRSKTKPPKIRITVTKNNNMTEITVADNGVGINLEDHGKYIFGLYKRFNLEAEGKGLGLHMTKLQIEAMSGTIHLESKVNEGTTFTIKLP